MVTKAATKKTAVLSGEIHPLDLRTYDGPLYVRNNTATMISHDDGGRDGNGRLTLGSVKSGDNVAILPIDVAKHPSFQKLWRSGKVTVTTDPEMEAVLMVADAKIAEKTQAEAKALMAMMDKDPSKKDLVQRVLKDGTVEYETVEDKEDREAEEQEKLRSDDPSLVAETYYDKGVEKVRYTKAVLQPTLKGEK